VPKPQHLQLSIGQRVAQLVTPHDDASHPVARLVGMRMSPAYFYTRYFMRTLT
jgi:hypothetical protein